MGRVFCGLREGARVRRHGAAESSNARREVLEFAPITGISRSRAIVGPPAFLRTRQNEAATV
jgi:hypothetical protein